MVMNNGGRFGKKFQHYNGGLNDNQQQIQQPQPFNQDQSQQQQFNQNNAVSMQNNINNQNINQNLNSNN